MAERQSVIRKIYLYVFLFAATMTILSSAVFLVSRVLYWALSGRIIGNPVSEVGHAIAFTVIAAAVWLYHGALLRQDGRALKADEAARLTGIRVAVLDTGDGRLGKSVVEALERRLPGLAVMPMGVTPAAAAALGNSIDAPHTAETLAQSRIIVAPWSLVTLTSARPDIAAAIAASPARKLLLPVAADGWLLVGASDSRPDDLAAAAVEDVARLATGEETRARRPASAARVVLLAIAALIGLLIVSQIVMGIVSMIVFR